MARANGDPLVVPNRVDHFALIVFKVLDAEDFREEKLAVALKAIGGVNNFRSQLKGTQLFFPPLAAAMKSANVFTPTSPECSIAFFFGYTY